MRKDYLQIVVGMALLGGLITGSVIYVGNTFAQATPVVVVATPTATLPPPNVSTVIVPTATTMPTVTSAPVLRARLSHYWPQWGPPNCHSANWDGNKCEALLTDGKQWQHWSYWTGRGTACPREFERGTVFRIPDFGDFICIDRGGAINMLPDGTFFLDLLTTTQPYVAGGTVIRDEFSPSGSYVVIVTVVK